jgi:hypothetical protein
MNPGKLQRSESTLRWPARKRPSAFIKTGQTWPSSPRSAKILNELADMELATRGVLETLRGWGRTACKKPP